jgi:hypothetical protein
VWIAVVIGIAFEKSRLCLTAKGHFKLFPRLDVKAAKEVFAVAGPIQFWEPGMECWCRFPVLGLSAGTVLAKFRRTEDHTLKKWQENH